jgi:hypothetical protein
LGQFSAKSVVNCGVKLILPFFFCLVSLTSFSQSVKGIEYSSNGAFNWDMFKGKVNAKHIAQMGKNTGAVTVSALSYETLGTKGNKVSLKICALFIPQESWTRYPKLYHPEEALNHEKRHFDICEIYARKFRRLVSQTDFSQRNFSSTLNYLFKQTMAEYRQAQAEYDNQTHHSLDDHQQDHWNTKIDNELRSLADYSEPVITVSLN